MTLKTFSIQNKNGMSYIGKIDIDNECYGLKIETVKGKPEILADFNPSLATKFITIQNPWILAPQRTSTGVQVIPTKLSDSPNGSESIAMNIDNIGDINLIDDNSDLLVAMRASESGLELAGSSADVAQSSRIINKFGR